MDEKTNDLVLRIAGQDFSRVVGPELRTWLRDRTGMGADVVEMRSQVRGAMRNVRETRVCPLDFELRDVANGTGGTDLLFTGFASVTCAQDSDSAAYEMEDFLGPWTESVSTGAFKKTLADSADVAFLVNHEGLTLARTKSGTLKLAEVASGDPTGLHSEARLDPKSPHVKALRSAVERGDVDEMSFAFRVTRQEWSEDYDRRWINEVNLQNGDVSAVNYGANPHTAGLVAMRKRLETVEPDPATRVLIGMLEERAGAKFSSANVATLKSILSAVNAADSNIDQALVDLSGLIGVPNPDTDAPAASASNDPGTDDDQTQLSKSRLVVPDYTSHARLALAKYRKAA